ncbi:MAG: hypothetical protein Q4G45_06515 [Actinomycetia bacterium]|nr:hypothetical protein [Actinomycetes bacterium]
MTVFLIIGGVGVALLLFTLLLGELFDGLLDALGGGDWFSGSSLAAFVGALGFGGAIIYEVTGNLTLAVIGGIILGLGLGFLIGYAVLRLRRSQDGAAPTSEGLLDRVGVVISDIPSQGMGEIRVLQDGHMTKLYARAPEPLPAGTQVTITDVLSATSVKVIPTYR